MIFNDVNFQRFEAHHTFLGNRIIHLKKCYDISPNLSPRPMFFETNN